MSYFRIIRWDLCDLNAIFWSQIYSNPTWFISSPRLIAFSPALKPMCLALCLNLHRDPGNERSGSDVRAAWRSSLVLRLTSGSLCTSSSSLHACAVRLSFGLLTFLFLPETRREVDWMPKYSFERMNNIQPIHYQHKWYLLNRGYRRNISVTGANPSDRRNEY